LFLALFANAQDPQFSQIYAIPLYMGPSFAGSAGSTRIGMNIRDQWAAVDREYISYSLSVDHYFDGTNNGVGAILYRDHSGMGNLTTTSISLQYAYSFNVTKKFSIRPGIQLSIVNRKIDYSEIVFGDQLSLQGIKPNTIEPLLENNVTYADFGVSALANHPNYWFGLSLDHLTQPNQSMMGAKSLVPLKMNVFSGVKFMVKNRGLKTYKRNIYLVAQYKSQSEYNQAYFGGYWENNNVITGLWYRGIPFVETYSNYVNNDAIVFLIGYRWREYTFGYSYDFTTSHLGSNSAGSHEVSLVWKKKPKSKKKKWDVISCPGM